VPDVDEFSRIIDQELAAQGAGLSAAPPPAAASGTPARSASAEMKKPAKPPTAAQKTASAPGASEPASSSFGLLGSPPGGAFSSFQAGGVACSEAEANMKQPTLINTSQLRELLRGKTKPLFVDVRPAKEFAEGQIPGAINIPVDDMPRRWSTLPKDRVIVFYENGGSGDICAAARAAGRILLQQGYPFDQVKVYQDGLTGWNKSGLNPVK
jgi:rhodanese-related sulfurtransferase